MAACLAQWPIWTACGWICHNRYIAHGTRTDAVSCAAATSSIWKSSIFRAVNKKISGESSPFTQIGDKVTSSIYLKFFIITDAEKEKKLQIQWSIMDGYKNPVKITLEIAGNKFHSSFDRQYNEPLRPTHNSMILQFQFVHTQSLVG